MILKEELGSKSWVMEAFVGAICSVVTAVLLGDDVASGMALTKPRFCFNFATIFAAMDHGRPRSDYDQASIVLQNVKQILVDDR